MAKQKTGSQAEKTGSQAEKTGCQSEDRISKQNTGCQSEKDKFPSKRQVYQSTGTKFPIQEGDIYHIKHDQILNIEKRKKGGR